MADHPFPAGLKAGVLGAIISVAAWGGAPPSPGDPSVMGKRLIDAALASKDAYSGLVELCDTIGPRLSGSPGLDRAVGWAEARMKKAGLDAVRLEPVTVPVWERGEEAATLVAPMRLRLNILGLGMSVGTQGLTAEVAVVGSFEELDRMGTLAKGKIILFDVPFTTYEDTVEFRESGASRAAKYGAVAVLVRSVTAHSLDTPHTGSVDYDEKVPSIPAAAITTEGAALLHRLVDRGEKPKVALRMGARTLHDAPSNNVIGEIRGRERPEEIVLVAAHLDSWDVGQGAQDNGTGCMMALEAVRLIKALGEAPRRTIRVVLFTNEENGGRGTKAYLSAHKMELKDHVVALESDRGNGRSDGFLLDLRGFRSADPKLKEGVLGSVRQLAALLAPLKATEIDLGNADPDAEWFVAKGIPGLALNNDTTHYFDVHHSWADTVDKVNPQELARNTAIMAGMLYALAEAPERLAAAR